MWLMSYITKNSLNSPNAVKGDVSSVKDESLSVISSGEYKNLKSCFPYGIASAPPVGECAVVLPLDDGEVNLGVVAKKNTLEEGELMLYSKGGASIVLKNDGKVIINGKEFTG